MNYMGCGISFIRMGAVYAVRLFEDIVLNHAGTVVVAPRV